MKKHSRETLHTPPLLAHLLAIGVFVILGAILLLLPFGETLLKTEVTKSPDEQYQIHQNRNMVDSFYHDEKK